MIHLRDLDKNNNMSKKLAVVFQMPDFLHTSVPLAQPNGCLLLELFSSILPNVWCRSNFASALGESLSVLGDQCCSSIRWMQKMLARKYAVGIPATGEGS